MVNALLYLIFKDIISRGQSSVMKEPLPQPRVSQRDRRDRFDILEKIIALTNSELDLDSVLKGVVELVAHVTHADSVFIYLFTERDQLSLLASKIPHPKVLGKVVLKVGEGITGWVAKENKPVAIRKGAYLDPRFKAFGFLPEDRYEAFLSVPVVYKGRPIGVVNIQHTEPHAYTNAVVRLMTTIAAQVGGLIENARLYDETKQKAKQLDGLMKVSQSLTSEKYLDEILNLIVVLAAETLNSKICSIMLVDEKNQSLIIKATQSLSPDYREKPPVRLKGSLSGDVLRSKKTRAVYDVKKETSYMFPDLAVRENLSSLLLVPMVIKDRAIGIVNVYTNAPHDFSEEEIKTLEAIAHQAAIAIENTKLMEESIRAREALETKKLVERAQHCLMKSQSISADTAYKLIHKKSMDSCRPMKEIAEAVLLALDLNATQQYT